MGKNLKDFHFEKYQLAEGIDQAGLGPAILIREGSFAHPKAPNGAFTITKATLESFKRNFDNNVRRLDQGELAIDYGHNFNGKAAGWIESVELLENGELQIHPRWTKNGEQSILEEEYKYLSADIDLDYIDNETGVNYGPTLLGAGLVNRPHVKAMRALFQEQLTEQSKGVFSMTPEEMMKKIGELEARVNELEGMLSTKAGELEEKTSELEVKSGELTEMSEEKKNAEMKLSETVKELTDLKEENSKVKKEARFSELLGEGKVAPAQKEAFMTMELSLAESLFANAPVLNLSEQGSGKETERESGDDVTTAEDKVEAAAYKLQETNKNLSFSDAVSEVLRTDVKLAEEYEAEVNG